MSENVVSVCVLLLAVTVVQTGAHLFGRWRLRVLRKRLAAEFEAVRSAGRASGYWGPFPIRTHRTCAEWDAAEAEEGRS